LVDIIQQADTTLLGLSPQEALKCPYVASMGVYVFKTDILLKLLKWRYPTSNDFGSEIIPAAVKEHNVQVRKLEQFQCLHLLILDLPSVLVGGGFVNH
jgi:glucose-1-phosphate adenylyltransferase